MAYDSINPLIIEQVPSHARTVLDLGCGGGSMGRLLKQTLGCLVVGVTVDPEEAALARIALDQIHVDDLNQFDPAKLGTFDCVICSHVLEHLYQPERLLVRLRRALSPTGVLLVALPNVLFWKQRLEFLSGSFRYTAGGIMDRTHYRFYDWRSARALIESSGYVVLSSSADGGFPLSRMLGRGLARPLDRLATKWFPGLFGWQFVFRCQLNPQFTGSSSAPKEIRRDAPVT